MQPKSDAQLLRDYAQRGEEAAFTELVRRNLNLVYSAALRLADSPDCAAEISQNVFIGLARGAPTLASTLEAEASLAGWLCRSARNLSLNHRRDEFRRQHRERQAMEQLIATSDAPPDWEHLRGVLDDAMAELGEADYDALVLRYFQNQDFRSVGTAIGVSDDTAQKRVARALDKLRDLLARRGVRSTTAALAIAISAHAVQAAPAALALTISTAALAGMAISTAAIVTATTKTIAMTTLQKSLVAVAIVATGAIPLVTQQRSLTKLRAENQALSQQVGQLESLPAQAEDLTNSPAASASGNGASRDQISELLRLRNAVALLRQQTNEMATLRAENRQLRSTLQVLKAPAGPPTAADVATAKALILNAGASLEDKLEALRTLRSANSRTDDVVKEMVNAYYSTDNADLQADIFRQLSGVTTPELKRPLLEAVGNAKLDTNVRQEAAETLAEYAAEPDVKKWLEHVGANDPDAEVRKEALRSLEAGQPRRRQ